MKTSDVLKGAREFLETHNWIQGYPVEYGNLVGPTGACAVGALYAFRHLYSGVLLEDQNKALDYLDLATPPEYHNGRLYPSAEFNDVPGRTKGEVLDLYDHAIKRAEEDELVWGVA